MLELLESLKFNCQYFNRPDWYNNFITYIEGKEYPKRDLHLLKDVGDVQKRIDYEEEQKAEWGKTHKFKFWFLNFMDDYGESILFFPYDVYRGIIYTIKNIKNKSHIMHSPRFEIGRYHSIDEKLFHCCFQELVDFVEIELAYFDSIVCNHEVVVNSEEPYYEKYTGGRRPDLGIRHLEWEISLGDECKHQSESAKKKLELYLWYTYERVDFNNIDESLYTTSELIEKEQELYEIDTRKLIELIEIRQSLWT